MFPIIKQERGNKKSVRLVPSAGAGEASEVLPPEWDVLMLRRRGGQAYQMWQLLR